MGGIRVEWAGSPSLMGRGGSGIIVICGIEIIDCCLPCTLFSNLIAQLSLSILGSIVYIGVYIYMY